MEAIVNWLKETHQKNWVLFTVVLGIVNAIWLRCLTGHWFCFNIGENHAGFLALEIMLTSLAVTRILVAMDIIYLLQIAPITGDLIILVDRRKRMEITFLSKECEMSIIEEWLHEHASEVSNPETFILRRLELVHNDSVDTHLLFHHYKHRRYKKYYTATYYTFAFLMAGFLTYIFVL
jgi:hypothetical protein